jgi:hypothetical protein
MAIATESGYGAFLPTYENEFVNREVLRGQMVKQASYLTEMDSIYARLEEQAREFDVGLEATEERWRAELEERGREFDESNRLGWAQQETSSYSAHATAGNQAAQIANQQAQYEQNRLDDITIANRYTNTMANRPSQQTTYQDIWASVAGTGSGGTIYNEYGQVTGNIYGDTNIFD